MNLEDNAVTNLSQKSYESLGNNENNDLNELDMQEDEEFFFDE